VTEALVPHVLGAVLLAGFAGGAHCAAMCGPLVGVACGAGGGRHGQPWLARAFAYNSGRIASYVAAGAMAGALGTAGVALRGGPALQEALVIVMSIALLFMAAYIGGAARIVRGIESAGAVLWRRIEPLSRGLLPATTWPRAFGLGLIWGWLPCGMVYLALVAAFASGGPLEGAAVMAAFGLGTLPNLLAIWAWFRYALILARNRAARTLAAVLVGAVGVYGLVAGAGHAPVFAPAAIAHNPVVGHGGHR
jgi:hypothetical protein